MGDLRPDNGGVWPSEEGQGGLPNIPPEWGTIVIPDDAAELDGEASALRRELRRAARKARWRSALGLRPQGEDSTNEPYLPFLIMFIAILTTLVSVFIITSRPRSSLPPPADKQTTSQIDRGGELVPVTELLLTTADNKRVRVGTLLPAVLLLIDGCPCEALVRDAAAALPDGFLVVAVGPTPPALGSPPANARGLTDPDGLLRARFAPTSDQAPTTVAVMIDKAGTIKAISLDVRSIDDLRFGISRLTGR